MLLPKLWPPWCRGQPALLVAVPTGTRARLVDGSMPCGALVWRVWHSLAWPPSPAGSVQPSVMAYKETIGRRAQFSVVML